MNIPLLQCVSVAFSYAGRKVLEDVTLSLEAGSCSALVGPNGAGKTTLLRLLSGGCRPAAGEVLLKGRPLNQLARRERSRMIALVPQHLDVPFDFTVRQIVEQGRAPYTGLLRGLMREDRLAVDEAMEQAVVTGLSNRIFNELSGGERQRVKIALGLAQQPKLLLLDEPMQNLDIGRQAEVVELMHSLCDDGITIFASVHDLHLIPNNFETVHLLQAGGSLVSGLPREVLTTGHLSRVFGWSPDRQALLASYGFTEVSD